jgi:RimJ/RimL family protein N-acetyltransferase
MAIVLRDGAMTLRPFRRADLEDLWAHATSDRGSFEVPWAADDEAAKARLRARVTHSGTWHEGRVLDLAVEVDGGLAGDIQARRDPAYEPPGLFDLGIELFSDHRGRGLGTIALTILTSFLFDEEQGVRVSLSTDVDNVAMRRAAEKAGFSLEGIMRGFWQVAANAPRDYALYARTVADHRRG